jgi:small subunit ribosomal protein S4e
MVKNHLKSIPSPKSWQFGRKKNAFILRPSPGPHSLKESVSLRFLLTNILHMVNTKKEAVYLLQNKEILVDGVRRKERDFPVGLFDTISIPELAKYYRVIMDNRGKIGIIEIEDKEALSKVCKIIGKSLVRKMTQLNLSDGRNLLVDKDPYNVGDTIILHPVKKSVLHHIKMEKGNMIYLVKGAQRGSIGHIEDTDGKKLIYKNSDGQVCETLKEYAFVIGKDKPVLTITK